MDVLMETFGRGYRAKLGGLLIKVEVGPQSWAYLIYRDGVEAAGHDPVWPENWDEVGAKREAVQRALQILVRDDDPKAVSESLTWEPYGPGHPSQS